MIRLRAAALLGLWLLPPGAAAQTPALPVLPAPSDPVRPGLWVQYLLTSRTTRQSMLVRLAALEREGRSQWFELGFTDSLRRTLVMKVLVEGTLQAPKRVLRAVVQPHGQQPLELPPRLAVRQLPRFGALPASNQAAVKLGKQRLTVAAGTFEAERFRIKEGTRTVEVWTSHQVAGWPMIRLQSPDLLLELSAFGSSGSSQIRGKPARLDERWLGGGAAGGSGGGPGPGSGKSK